MFICMLNYKEHSQQRGWVFICMLPINIAANNNNVMTTRMNFRSHNIEGEGRRERIRVSEITRGGR